MLGTGTHSAFHCQHQSTKKTGLSPLHCVPGASLLPATSPWSLPFISRVGRTIERNCVLGARYLTGIWARSWNSSPRRGLGLGLRTRSGQSQKELELELLRSERGCYAYARNTRRETGGSEVWRESSGPGDPLAVAESHPEILRLVPLGMLQSCHIPQAPLRVENMPQLKPGEAGRAPGRHA